MPVMYTGCMVPKVMFVRVSDVYMDVQYCSYLGNIPTTF